MGVSGPRVDNWGPSPPVTSQESDHTSPAMAGSSVAGKLPLLFVSCFWQGLAAPEASSLSRQRREGSSSSMEDCVPLLAPPRRTWLPHFLASPGPAGPGDPTLPAHYVMGVVLPLQSASTPFMPPAFAWALLCLQDCALVSVRPLHPSASLLSPVLHGGLAPFPPFLPHFFPHRSPAPRTIALPVILTLLLL